jgi:hypothetical protein
MGSSGVESIIRMGRLTTSTSLQRKTNSLLFGCLIVDDTMTWKEYWQMTKWEWFIEGFRNISYIIDCYDTVEHFPDDFWEALSWGWMCSEIYPYDDPYNPYISPERKLRLGRW